MMHNILENDLYERAIDPAVPNRSNRDGNNSNNNVRVKGFLNRIKDTISDTVYNIFTSNIKNLFIKTIKVRENTPVAAYIMKWLYKLDKQKYEKNLDAISKFYKNIHSSNIITLDKNCNYTIYHKKKKMLINVHSDFHDNGDGCGYADIVITFIGIRKTIDRYIECMINHFSKTTKSNNAIIEILTYIEKHERYFINNIPFRSLDSIFIEKNSRDELDNYLKNMKESTSYFSKFGLSPKYGILLYGSPGTGKSSIITAIASEYNMNIYYMSLSNISECVSVMQDDINRIQNSRNANLDDDPRYNLMVFEDIDYIFGKRDEERSLKDKQNANDLLQVLDGLKSVPNTLVIATTNDLESLDKAITRPGRFDLQLNIDNISKPVAEDMCKYYKCDLSVLDNESFPINPAYLQSKIIKHMNNKFFK